MAVFSKFNRLNFKMWLVGDLSPPLSVPTVISTFIVCVLSFYLFKWLSGDGNVPIRDSSKNHSWTPIKIASKVTVSYKPSKLHPNFRLGTALFASLFFSTELGFTATVAAFVPIQNVSKKLTLSYNVKS